MLQMIKAFALFGGEWVLYLLLALSIWSIAVIWDRFFLFRKKARNTELLEEKVPSLLAKGQLKEVQKLVENITSPAAAILKVGLANISAGPDALGQIMESQRIREKTLMEKNLLVLGTLGSNAPFIGLFGTVLGIIKAFNDLALAGTSGPTVVMRGVSEALVATAVGLLIAIPCVATYNYFQNLVKLSLANADRLSGLLLAYVQRKKG
jgi:biopolymer transport protein ExbB/TolQ